MYILLEKYTEVKFKQLQWLQGLINQQDFERMNEETKKEGKERKRRKKEESTNHNICYLKKF